MSQSSSSDSHRSQTSEFTQYSHDSISPARLIVAYPTGFNNSSYGDEYYGNSGFCTPTVSTTTQPSNSLQNQVVRHTPTSLGWENYDMWKYYDFELPAKESRMREPRLVLRNEFGPSDYTPSEVYLDKELNPRKGYHPCQFPGKACWKKGTRPCFSRSADLTRHYSRLHISDEKKESIYCDYSHCDRAKNPFGRKDHWRDHLRDFHKEDMSRPKDTNEETIKETWRAERNINIKWWRCSKCLTRTNISRDGWKCPGCKQDCEDERITARTGEVKTESVPDCRFCGGERYYDGGNGEWVACVYCLLEQPLQTYGNSYGTAGEERAATYRN